MSAPLCPLCGSGAPKREAGAHGAYRLWDCPDCGAGFCEPFKNPGAAFYQELEDMYPAAVEETTDPMSFEYDEALALLRREVPAGGTLLDVGCGAGGFLHRARAAGFRPTGVDFNADRAALLRARGFDVRTGSLPALAAELPPGSFDAATMFQVLEHLDDPAEWLAAARKLLKPGGLLLVGVPNRDRAFDPFRGPMAHIDLPPHHLTRWSAGALRRFLAARDFAVAESRPLGYPLPLVQLLLRDRLSFGVARRALGVDQTRHAPAAGAAPAGSRAVRAAVRAKEAVLDGAAALAYPLFRLACGAFGWQGTVLLAAARPAP